MIDLVASYTFNKNVSGTMYWGHAFGGDVIENIYSKDKDGDYFYFELNVSF